ncbi:hypothetical protein ACSQ67_005449 [Phaseolus vulgaris]
MSSNSKENGVSLEVEKVDDSYLSAVLLCFSSVLPAVLNAAIDMNLFDVIAKAKSCCDDASFSASQIASLIPNEHPQLANRLERMLPLLVSYSLLHCSIRSNEDGKRERVYALSPVGEYFAYDHEGNSVAPLSTLFHRGFHNLWKDAKGAYLDSNCSNHFESVYGMLPFEYMEKDTKLNEMFFKAMAHAGPIEVKRVIKVYKGFEGLSTLVDVGGIEHVGGDMFESVPSGDAILVKFVCHNWADEDCIKVLRNCHKALPAHGKVIVMEYIIPEVPNSSDASKHTTIVDNHMFLAHGGRERTEIEFENLARALVFLSFMLHVVAYHLGVMEFYK